MSEKCEIKICGITRECDVELVCASGADYIGLLIDMPSARTLDLEKAAGFASKATIPVILLFMNAEIEKVVAAVERINPFGVQITGEEPPEYIAELRPKIKCSIWKGVHLPAEGTSPWSIEEYEQKIKRFCDAGADRILLDTSFTAGDKKVMGGTGKTYDWKKAAALAAKIDRPVVMAGGLNPSNVVEAIRTVRPCAVDLASGVESQKGIKDPSKVTDFVKKVRQL
ncbi:MAG TPA: phosphoribosylanthranilate isomerase [bacterium]|nr:phosphoribosylanthranilate isomerase [bacterium]